MSDERDQPVKVVDRRWWVQQAQEREERGNGGAEEPAFRPGKPSYVEELEQKLADRDRQLQDVLQKYRDASREFEDARARMRRDLGREVERARRAFLADLLEVLDNLDRAIEAGRQGAGPDALLNGVDLARRSFLAKLEGLGIRRVDALGKAFDPARHEAMTMVPTDDPAQDGTVCGVLAEGYAIGDEVLRPARVAVAQLGAD